MLYPSSSSDNSKDAASELVGSMHRIIIFLSLSTIEVESMSTNIDLYKFSI
jgi:hypothetical protein